MDGALRLTAAQALHLEPSFEARHEFVSGALRRMPAVLEDTSEFDVPCVDAVLRLEDNYAGILV